MDDPQLDEHQKHMTENKFNEGCIYCQREYQESRNILEQKEEMKINISDISKEEELFMNVSNLCAMEEHLVRTYQDTKKDEYLSMLDNIRKVRVGLMDELVKNKSSDLWCISKHILNSFMRSMEVGTKELRMGNKEKAKSFFELSKDLHDLFFLLQEIKK